MTLAQEDLLAHYLTHTNADDEHDFVVPPHVNVIPFDHLYRGMRDDVRYIAKKSADEISYLIDELIEHVSRNAANHTLIDCNELPFHDQERAFTFLPRKTGCRADISRGPSSTSGPLRAPAGQPEAGAS